MLIVMKSDATPEQIDAVCSRLRGHGYAPQTIAGSAQTVIDAGQAAGDLSDDAVRRLAGVADCVPANGPDRLVARREPLQATVVDVRGERIGGGAFQIIAGPCAVESRDQLMRTAQWVARCGVKFLRGGAFKPRSSPYAFQGLRDEGLKFLAEAGREFDLRIVTEVKDGETLEQVAAVADVLQIGSRNMQNFSLLEAVGRQRKPVLLKRGMGSRLDELFMAAEYVMAQGNRDVILCERGIRTFETLTRNTFDLSAVVMARHHTHLPIVADPSHGVGIGWAVPALARASVVAGADAVMVEVHPNPAEALSDGQQALTLDAFERLSAELNSLRRWVEDAGEAGSPSNPRSAKA